MMLRPGNRCLLGNFTSTVDKANDLWLLVGGRKRYAYSVTCAKMRWAEDACAANAGTYRGT